MKTNTAVALRGKIQTRRKAKRAKRQCSTYEANPDEQQGEDQRSTQQGEDQRSTQQGADQRSTQQGEDQRSTQQGEDQRSTQQGASYRSLRFKLSNSAPFSTTGSAKLLATSAGPAAVSEVCSPLHQLGLRAEAAC